MYNWSVNKFYKVLVMQVVENTCIGHGISLRKISEPLALKALDFRPVTAQPQEMQCCRSATSLMWRPQRVAFRNLSATLSKSRIPDHLPKEPRYSLEQVPEASRAQSCLLDRTHVNTQTPEVIFKTHTCQSSFYRNSHRIIIFRIWKTDTQSEDFIEEKKT